MSRSTGHTQHDTPARPEALADCIKYRDMIGLDVTLEGLEAASPTEASTSLFMAELDVARTMHIDEVQFSAKRPKQKIRLRRNEKIAVNAAIFLDPICRPRQQTLDVLEARIGVEPT